MIFQTTNLTCCRCDKSISRNQAIFYRGFYWCLDSLLNRLAAEPEIEDARVDVSVDLLSRLRDGVL